MASDNEKLTFWDHLEVLRGVIFRILIAAFVTFIAVFCIKEPLFRLVMAPSQSDFILYRTIAQIASGMGVDADSLQNFEIEIFNTKLTAQFMIHMKMAFYCGLIAVLPYTLYLLFGFISPALYQHEKRESRKVVVWSYILFMTGIALDYVLIFPLAFRFLGTYQVSPDIPNVIDLDSYINLLVTLTLMMGVLFELPILAWFLARLGIVNADFMKKYRKHAVMVILVIAAIITPTTDVFTLTIVTLPIYLLYEASIGIVSRVNPRQPDIEETEE